MKFEFVESEAANPKFEFVDKTIASSPNKKEESIWDKIMQGADYSVMSTGLGVKDLVGSGSEFDEKYLAELKQKAHDDLWGILGQVGTDVLQMAIPGMGLAKGLSALNAGRKAIIGSESLLAGLFGGSKLPEEDETRLGNASSDAVITALGGTLFESLGKAARGFTKTPEAEELIKKGVNLTPGQASTGASALESMMSVVPFLAKPTNDLREEASDQVRNLAYNMSKAPLTKPVTKDGFEATRELRDGFSAGYDQAWKIGAEEIDKGAFGDVITEALRASKVIEKTDRNKLKASINNLRTKVANNNGEFTASMLSDFDKAIRKNAYKAETYESEQALKEISRTLRENLPADAKIYLDKLDAEFPKYMTIRDASKKATTEKGAFDLNQLATSSRKIGRDKSGLGEAPLQDLIDLASPTVMKDLEGQPLDFLRRMSVNILGPTNVIRKGAKPALGDTALQKAAVRGYDRSIGGIAPRNIINAVRGKTSILDVLLQPNEEY